jgi:hypothetical protein
MLLIAEYLGGLAALATGVTQFPGTLPDANQLRSSLEKLETGAAAFDNAAC